MRASIGAVVVSALIALVLVPAAAMGDESADARPLGNAHIAPLVGSGPALVGWFGKPAGAGPFPAVLLLHGCHGLVPVAYRGHQAWATFLQVNGYATLIVDSYVAPRPRPLCNGDDGMLIRERAGDVYSAAAYLGEQPDIRADRIFAVGFSGGGWTLLQAAAANRDYLEPYRHALSARGGRLVAVAPMYPSCRDSQNARFIMPVLIQIGTADDWVSPHLCEALATSSRAGGPELAFREYRGATHTFDTDAPERWTGGHRQRYDPAATAAARAEILAFFGRYLE